MRPLAQLWCHDTPTTTLECALGTRPLPTSAPETRATDHGTEKGTHTRRLNLKTTSTKARWAKSDEILSFSTG